MPLAPLVPPLHNWRDYAAWLPSGWLNERPRDGRVIRLRVLGPIELLDAQGNELRAILAQPKRLALLVYLAAGSGGFHRRDTLLGLFWPELDERRGRDALNQAIRFLRKELGGSTESII